MNPHARATMLRPEQLQAILRALPECRLPLKELDERIGLAIMEYSFAMEEREAQAEWRASKPLLTKLLTTSRKLRRYTQDKNFAHLRRAVSFSKGFSEEQLLGFIKALEACERKMPKQPKGGSKDAELNRLLIELADIYTDATGRAPSSSRTVKRPEAHGPWLDFWTAATAGGTVLGEKIATKGRAGITEEAIELRWRRTLGHGQRAKKNSGAHNFQDAPEHDTLAASARENADAQNTGPNRRSHRGGRRAGLR